MIGEAQLKAQTLMGKSSDEKEMQKCSEVCAEVTVSQDLF